MNVKVFKDNLTAAIDAYEDRVDPEGAPFRELARRVEEAERRHNSLVSRAKRFFQR